MHHIRGLNQPNLYIELLNKSMYLIVHKYGIDDYPIILYNLLSYSTKHNYIELSALTTDVREFLKCKSLFKRRFFLYVKNLSPKKVAITGI